MLGFVTCEDVDVVVVQRRSSDHEPMRMKSRSSYRSRSVAKKPRIGLEIRHRLTGVDIEDFDAMFLCATDKVSMKRSRLLDRKYLRRKDGCVLVDAQRPQVIRGC
jgi:hypothetical protein